MTIVSKIPKGRHLDIVEKFYVCKALSLDKRYWFYSEQYSCKHTMNY
jgi:hypothetical protein